MEEKVPPLRKPSLCISFRVSFLAVGDERVPPKTPAVLWSKVRVFPKSTTLSSSLFGAVALVGDGEFLRDVLFPS